MVLTIRSYTAAAEEPPKKKKKKKKAAKKQAKIIKPDATSKAATKATAREAVDLSEAILGNSDSKNTMKVSEMIMDLYNFITSLIPFHFFTHKLLLRQGVPLLR